MTSGNRTAGMPQSTATDLIILIHGIRTRARWQNEIRAELERAGFVVELTNYGRFDLIKFLLPIWAFRLTVIDSVREQISVAIRRHPGLRVSFIAHSFGTFVLGHILRASMGLKIERIVLCGSVLPYDFPFGEVVDGATIVNDVGGRDFLPALAERVTWGYGSSGTYGFHVPGVRDRHHNELPHSGFLASDFCKEYWVPFFQDGAIIHGDEVPAKPAKMIAVLLLLLNKYVLIAAAVLGVLWNHEIRAQPISIDVSPTGGIAFLGQPIADLIASIRADGCTESWWLWDILRQRRCVQLQRVDGGATDLVLCAVRPIQLSDRDPLVVLQHLAERAPCLQIAVQGRQVSVELDDQQIREVRSQDDTYRLCACADDAVQAFKAKYGKRE